MTKLLSYLVLPATTTEFERSYLRRMNRIALGFFYLHLPVFIVIAWSAGTSVLQAAVLTPIVLVGPTLAYFTFKNPRRLSMTYGFTAMVMGGLLVHFGQGAMQIEMHFYFFVLIALLAVFGNPMVILTAAVTVAVHHLVVWLVIPASVFNYEASVWTVAVHAAFVVLESVAAVFVARSFFDNVIGLEQIVAARTAALDERTAAMRLVLDNVDQGFTTVNLSGAMSPEHSRILETWLGPVPESGDVFEYLAAADPDVAAQLRLGWDELASGAMPLELTLHQLPSRLTVGTRELRLEYQPIGEGDVPALMMLVISDITAELGRERADLERREMVAVFERFAKDRAGFIEFFDEADELVRALSTPGGERTEVMRKLHTLKGNTALFGIETLSAYCHELETRLIDDADDMTEHDRKELAGRWRSFIARIEALLGARDAGRLEITTADIDRVIKALHTAQPAADIEQIITAWRLEAVGRRFERAAEQIQRVARRLGKDIAIEIDDRGLRLEPHRWSSFWTAFVHAVRNAVDHGIERSDERLAAGKSAQAKVVLSAAIEGSDLVIEIRDDGRGVNWELVRERATALGLQHETREQLTAALFADGMSTKSEVTDLSGRGVGLSALRAAAIAHGGGMTIISESNLGTRVRFEFPLKTMPAHERPFQRQTGAIRRIIDADSN